MSEYIPVVTKVLPADVWIRCDYQSLIQLGDVHLVRASKVQLDDDYYPLYDCETVELLQLEIERLRTELATARNDALEEAAHYCEGQASVDVVLAHRCADAIRAMKVEVPR